MNRLPGCGLRIGACQTPEILVSADVTGARDESRVGYGPTSVMTPQAEVVAQVPTMSVGMVVAEIDVSQDAN
jgi:hypothetical protein